MREEDMAMSTNDMILILDKYRNGANIQARLIANRHQKDAWHNLSDPLWNFGEMEYRVKPSTGSECVKAFEDGRAVQWQWKSSADETKMWSSVLSNHDWKFYAHNYRIVGVMGE